MSIQRHVPVLLNQVTEYLNPEPGKVYIDCTLGTGGHTEALLKKLGGTGAVYGIDADSRNLEIAKEHLKDYKNFHPIHDNFENLELHAAEIKKVEGKINGILFDLGLSSLHVDEHERGFSFQSDGPLDMRFDTRQGETAADIVNTYTQDQLLLIFKHYGQEKYAYRIASEIVRHRRDHQFATTSQLADFIETVVSQGKYFYHKRHPATRIFQALRIAANREVDVLEKGLTAAINVISEKGRIVVISYHSLEDRIVKNSFRNAKRDGILHLLTKKPITPTEEEQTENRRSRSALLRAAERN